MVVLVLAVAWICPSRGWCGENQNKAAVDFQFNLGRMIFRFRPLDYVWPSGTRRTDFLLGRRFGPFTAFAYWKNDSQKRSWLGGRLDCDIRAFHQRLSAKVQVRFFQGLNHRAKQHYYFVPAVFYQLGRQSRIRAGFLGYGKKNKGERISFFFGPAAVVMLTRFLQTRVSWGWDLLGKGTLFYVKGAFRW